MKVEKKAHIKHLYIYKKKKNNKKSIPIVRHSGQLKKKRVSIEKNNLAFYNFVCVVKAIL